MESHPIRAENPKIGAGSWKNLPKAGYLMKNNGNSPPTFIPQYPTLERCAERERPPEEPAAAPDD